MSESAEHSSHLQDVLKRADKPHYSSMGGLPVRHSDSGTLQLSNSDALVERLPIQKVSIKLEVANYIDRVFATRTQQDGTILVVSKETLIEELTRLFVSLEDQASQIDHLANHKANGKSRGRTNPFKSETEE